MRKFGFVILLLVCIMFLCPSSVQAEGNFQIDGSTLTAYTGADSTIIIPNGVTVIGVNAFTKNTKIREVYFPDTLTKIDAGAFEYCPNLERVVLPNSLTEIGALAFRGCESLEYLEIPEGVGSVGSNAFLECSSLRVVLLPASLRYIEYGIFAACSELSDIQVTDGNPKYVCIDNVLYTADGETLVQYPAGKKDSRVEVREGVRKIERSAFNGCDSIKEIIFPDTVTELGIYSFKDCSSISEILLPQSVAVISDHAFWGCTSLSKIVINNKGATFGERVFEQDVVLCSAANSSTERYAEANGIKFEIISNGDNTSLASHTVSSDKTDKEEVKIESKQYFDILFFILLAILILSFVGIIITVSKMTAKRDERGR